MWFDTTFSTRFIAALIAFIINYAAYFSEIFRGGIESIPKGQYEAGQVLGMTKSQIFFKVVLLQVTKRIMPPMINEIITLVKDTSLARIVAVYEIIWSAQVYIKSEGLIWPLFYTGAFYLLFSGLLTIIFAVLPVWNVEIATNPVAAVSVLTNMKFRIIIILAFLFITLIGITFRRYFHGPKYILVQKNIF